MNLIHRAAQFALASHGKQRRKWTDKPYITHPMRVAGMVSLHPCAADDLIAAAWLHDTIEDCAGVTAGRLAVQFGEGIAGIVQHLTNVSKLQHPEANRAERKRLDRERLATIPQRVKIIKLIDRLDNVNEMSEAPEDFRRLYFEETALLVEVLRDADQVIADQILELIKADWD